MIEDTSACDVNCFIENDCVSFNVKPLQNGNYLCELSNSCDVIHPDDLKEEQGIVYTSFKVRAHNSCNPLNFYCISCIPRWLAIFDNALILLNFLPYVKYRTHARVILVLWSRDVKQASLIEVTGVCVKMDLWDRIAMKVCMLPLKFPPSLI